MTEEEGEEDLSKLIYDLPKCLIMTWEKLMGMTSTAGYDIWNEDVTKTPNYLTSTNRRRHFKPQSNYPTSTNWGGVGARKGRHFKSQASYQAPIYGRDTSNPKRVTKHPHTGGDTLNPSQTTQHPHTGGDTSNPKIPIYMTHEKLPTSQWGETLQTPTPGDKQPNRSLEQIYPTNTH